jgi:hypothetical protein
MVNRSVDSERGPTQWTHNHQTESMTATLFYNETLP